MAVLNHVHYETVNHQDDCYEKRYELENAASAGELAGLAQAAMRKAVKTDSIVVFTERENPNILVLRLPLAMKRETANRLQERMADYIRKSALT